MGNNEEEKKQESPKIYQSSEEENEEDHFFKNKDNINEFKDHSINTLNQKISEMFIEKMKTADPSEKIISEENIQKSMKKKIEDKMKMVIF